MKRETTQCFTSFIRMFFLIHLNVFSDVLPHGYRLCPLGWRNVTNVQKRIKVI